MESLVRHLSVCVCVYVCVCCKGYVVTSYERRHRVSLHFVGAHAVLPPGCYFYVTSLAADSLENIKNQRLV